MTVFKTFLKVLNKCKAPIIMYTAFLVFFGGFNMQTSDSSASFVADKPDILIINSDKDNKLTKNLVDYLGKNSNFIKIENKKEIKNGKNPTISIKSTNDSSSAYAEMILQKYLKIQTIYSKKITDEDKLISNINNTLDMKTKIEMTSKLDTKTLEKTSFYYNFTNYCILAGCIYVMCLILSSFHDEKIRKRTMISSMNYKKHNRLLLLSNGLFALVLWIFYVILSVILIGDIIFSNWGIIYIINSFIFTIFSVTLAFLISTLINDKNAINGLVNVVALGSSFLCGAFVPSQYLPDSVIKIAHIFPSYYYINTNDLVKTIEKFNFDTLKPIIINMGIIILFSMLCVVIANIISKKKQKIG